MYALAEENGEKKVCASSKIKRNATIILKHPDKEFLERLAKSPQVILETFFKDFDNGPVARDNNGKHDATEDDCSMFDDSDADPDYEPAKNWDKNTQTLFNHNDLNIERQKKYLDDNNKSQKKHLDNNNRIQKKHLDDNNKQILAKKVANWERLIVPTSGKKTKQQFCLFCEKLQTKFARHLELIHKEEEEVRKMILLPKRCPERLKIIEDLRKRGNFMFNTTEDINKGFIIVGRRPQVKHNRDANHYLPCGNCKGLYSKLSLRHHFRTCSGLHGQKAAFSTSRLAYMSIHPKASLVLRENIFPFLRDDDVTQIIKYDELVIIFGNKLVKKYRHPYHHSMIRAKLRTVGRFLLRFKQIRPEVEGLENICDPSYVDDVLRAIDIVAGLNESSGVYEAPSTAFNLGSYLKYISYLLSCECIKSRRMEKRELVIQFSDLLNEALPTEINKTVAENQLKMKRKKVIKLPNKDDIVLLRNYLRSKRRQEYHSLEKYGYNFVSWKKLCEYCLTSIQLFNRRRAGELERLEIEDFERRTSLENETYELLSEEARSIAGRYVRIAIRGKLGREVPVLISRELETMINLILAHRKDASVPVTNPYVFGLPGLTRNNYLRACNLMAKFSVECGASEPKTLRGTELRKHIATFCVALDLQENEIKDLANFLGHHEKIHMQYYRLPVKAKEITEISKLLEKALGSEENENDSDVENSLETSNNLIQMNETLNNSTNSTNNSTPNVHKRLSWSTPEKSAVKKIFIENLENEYLPTKEECAEAISAEPILKRRSASQVKAWVSNQIKKKQKTALTPEDKVKERRSITPWSSAERNVVTKIFSNHIEQRKLPSTEHCKWAIKSNPELKNREHQVLKSFISNEIRKNKFKNEKDISVNKPQKNGPLRI